MAGAIPSAAPTTPVQFTDPETGLTATRHDGQVWFKSGSVYFSADSIRQGLEHDPSAELATPEEVSHRLAVRAQDSGAGAGKIAAKEFAAHAIDVSTGLIRYPAMGLASLFDDDKALNELQQLGGQQVLENVYGIASELLSGQNQEAAGRQYHEATSAQAEANPSAALAGGIAGDVAPILATGGAAAAGKLTGQLPSEIIAEHTLGRLGTGLAPRIGAKALAGAIQGVSFGEQAASEAAYLQNEPLTRQKLWASGAMGGLFGGGISAGVGLAGAGIGAARTRLSDVLGRVAKPVPKGSLAEAIGDSEVTKEAAQTVAERVMASEGVPAAPGLGEKLHSLLTDIQAATTDGEKSAIKDYGLGAILDPKTRVKALSGIQMFKDRPIIIEKATGEIADSMAELEKHAGGNVFEQVRDLGMKRNAWEKLVDPAKRGEQVDAARALLEETRTRLEGMLPREAGVIAEAAPTPADYAARGIELPEGTKFADVSKKIFGRELSPADIEHLLGDVPEGLLSGEKRTIRVLSGELDQPELKLELNVGNDAEDAINIHRTYRRDANGALRAENNVFDLNESLQGKGLGSEIMARQLEKLKAEGASGIDLEASWQGPYVWSKAGFNVSDDEALAEMRSRFAEFLEDEGAPAKLGKRAKTSQQIADVEYEGEKLGKSFLRDYYATFDDKVPMHLESSEFDKAIQYFRRNGTPAPKPSPVVQIAQAATEDEAERIAYGDAARIKSALNHARRAAKALEGDADGATAAIELDAFKRSLGKLTKGSAKRLSNLRASGDFEADAVFNTAKAFSETYEKTRQLLMDQQLWGKAGQAQSEINAGWQQWLDSRRMYSGSLMRATGERASADIPEFGAGIRYEIDPDKVGSWIDKFGTGRGKLNDEYIRAHIDATENLTKTIGKYVDAGDLAASVQAVKDAAQRIKSNLKVASETVAVANQVQLAGSAHMTAAAKLGLTAAGAMAGGPIGGAAGAALGFLMSPGKVMNAAMALQGLMSKVDAQKASALKSFFSEATRKVGSAAKKAETVGEFTANTQALNSSGVLDSGKTTRRAMAAAAAQGSQFFGSGGQARADQYLKRREQLAVLTSNPDMANHQIQTTLGALPGIAPQLASSLAMDAMRNLSLLQQMAPPASPAGGMFGGRRKTFTPDSEIRKFAAQWDGVMNPLSVLADLKRGALNVDKVTAARMAHPELFVEIAGDFLEHMANLKEPMDPQAALQADLLLGLNGAGEPSVAPAFLARIASLNQYQEAQQQSQPTPRPPVNMAKGKATLSQSLEGV